MTDNMKKQLLKLSYVISYMVTLNKELTNINYTYNEMEFKKVIRACRIMGEILSVKESAVLERLFEQNTLAHFENIAERDKNGKDKITEIINIELNRLVKLLRDTDVA